MYLKYMHDSLVQRESKIANPHMYGLYISLHMRVKEEIWTLTRFLSAEPQSAASTTFATDTIIARVALSQTYQSFNPCIPADPLLLSSGIGTGFYESQSKKDISWLSGGGGIRTHDRPRLTAARSNQLSYTP